jgi:hypothetical protein
VKKLIALLVLAGTLLAGAIGCGPSGTGTGPAKPKPTSAPTGGTGS